MKRTEAVEAAWVAMLAEFPPLPKPASERAPDPHDSDAETIAAILSRTPEGEYDEFDDVAWAYDHLGDDLAPADFPGLGAWSLWTWARSHRARFYESLWPKVEAARANRYQPLRDPAVVQTIIEIEENRTYWKEQMAEDLPEAMRDLASNALWRDIEPRFDQPSSTDRGVGLLGSMMYKLSLRYVSLVMVSQEACRHEE